MCLMKKALWVFSMIFSLLSTSALALPLPDSLDCTNFVWTTGGQTNWAGQSTETHDGIDAAQSGVIGDEQECWLEAQMTGPGILTFWWKVSSEFAFDFLELYVDSELQDRISGEVDWQQGFFAVPAGVHAVRWRYTKDASSGMGADAGCVDQVSFVPTFTLATALNVSGFTVNSGGDATFFGETNITHDGIGAAQSGQLLDSQASWMETTVTGPVSVSFWWKVSSEAGFDKLTFQVNGVTRKEISGEVAWTKEAVSVPSGPQTLRWQYAKDSSTKAGQDAGWVDELSFAAFSISSLSFQPDRSALVRMSGAATGTIYRLQASSNLQAWTTIGQFSGGSCVDSGAANSRVRFYRIVSP